MRFRNPLFPDVDFEIACDQYKESSSSKSNGVNSGFIYLKATTKPTRFCEYWCKWFPWHEKGVFNLYKKRRYFCKGLNSKTCHLSDIFRVWKPYLLEGKNGNVVVPIGVVVISLLIDSVSGCSSGIIINLLISTSQHHFWENDSMVKLLQVFGSEQPLLQCFYSVHLMSLGSSSRCKLLSQLSQTQPMFLTNTHIFIVHSAVSIKLDQQSQAIDEIHKNRVMRLVSFKFETAT